MPRYHYVEGVAVGLEDDELARQLIDRLRTSTPGNWETAKVDWALVLFRAAQILETSRESNENEDDVGCVLPGRKMGARRLRQVR